MKKAFYIILLALLILLPNKVNAGIKTTMSCDEKRMDETLQHQIKTCYIDITITDEDALYSVNGTFTLINTSLKGNIEAVDKRIKITNNNLSNLTFVSETPIKNETIRIAKYTVYLAENGKECRVLWDPKNYGRNYSCTIENGYYYDKNGNSVTENEYNKQCKPHYCEVIDETYFDKDGKIVDKTEYSIQCEKHSCEVIDNTYFGKDGKIVDKTEYSIQCEKHSCEVIDNTYFGKDGKVVDKTEYSIQCEKHSCEVIGNTYFDKDGNKVNKTEYSKQCEKHSCEIVDGIYFGKEGTSVTDIEYDKQCNKHYCKIIDGTYFGKNGNIISKAKYNIECPADNPKTSSNGIFGYILIGTLITTFISIVLCFKQNNKKVFKI